MKDKIDQGLKNLKKLKKDLGEKGEGILKSKEFQNLKKKVQSAGDNLLKREEIQNLKKKVQSAGDNLLKREEIQNLKSNLQSASKKINNDKNLDFLTKIPKKILIISGSIFFLFFLFSGNSYENIYKCETNVTEYINLDINLRRGEEKVAHFGIEETTMNLDILENNSNYIKLRDHVFGSTYTFFKETNNLVLNMPDKTFYSYNCIIK